MPICKYYAKGNCKKGEDCSFTHVDNKVMDVRICKSYAKGHCKYGNKCRFAHVDADDDGDDDEDYHGNNICKFYANGYCKHGDNCRFDHVDNGDDGDDEYADDDSDDDDDEDYDNDDGDDDDDDEDGGYEDDESDDSSIFTDTENEDSDRWIIYRALRPGEAHEIINKEGILRGSPPHRYNNTHIKQHVNGVPDNLRKKNPWISGTYCREVVREAQETNYKNNSGAHGVAKIYLDNLDEVCNPIFDISTTEKAQDVFNENPAKNPSKAANFAASRSEVCVKYSIDRNSVKLLRTSKWQFL
eukprot:TRINITY_DN915_c4_g1_i1.p1 TRINITY_DN915_c4_g1~~TRINITY_DN915_c4_g1_i1.p1  ORF type:complete len:319 (+),score=67.85 TRINITY_DN915_c4_g1_i1:60-959(+)